LTFDESRELERCELIDRGEEGIVLKHRRSVYKPGFHSRLS